MKNTINYYYNIIPNNIHQTKDLYRFDYNHNNYVLFRLDQIDNANYYYELSVLLNSYGIYTHKILVNNQNQIITLINEKAYVLFEVKGNISEKITLNEILEFSNKTYGINFYNKQKIDWQDLWIKKQEYFEYQMKSIKQKYPLLNETSSYFFGLTYLSIVLLNNNYKVSSFSVQHKRINKDTTLFQFYNPFNFVIDSRVRDVAEYFKNTKSDINNIYNYINNTNLSNDEMLLFLIRMIYPSYYYDMYEQIITNLKIEEEINDIVDEISNREEILKKTYTYLISICRVPLIDWLLIR